MTKKLGACYLLSAFSGLRGTRYVSATLPRQSRLSRGARVISMHGKCEEWDLAPQLRD